MTSTISNIKNRPVCAKGCGFLGSGGTFWSHHRSDLKRLPGAMAKTSSEEGKATRMRRAGFRGQNWASKRKNKQLIFWKIQKIPWDIFWSIFGEAAKNYTFLKIKMDTQKGWALEKVTSVSKMALFWYLFVFLFLKFQYFQWFLGDVLQKSQLATFWWMSIQLGCPRKLGLTPIYTRFLSRWNSPLILSIDPNKPFPGHPSN